MRIYYELLKMKRKFIAACRAEDATYLLFNDCVHTYVSDTTRLIRDIRFSNFTIFDIAYGFIVFIIYMSIFFYLSLL